MSQTAASPPDPMDIVVNQVLEHFADDAGLLTVLVDASVADTVYTRCRLHLRPEAARELHALLGRR